ncbi:uncharacterized protein BDZ99DRAFT_503226 [Mytilinidion resinicola]|uniref:Uncharacterized protein n=1 Tax=Mytilinidion resinicola TaxID=574789 RepID=A0A6A6Y6I1_9PEZI|nr:uncharacterized protein BDZ99DRAFT_503226 [Mytilinidion resinicola]KAF2803624.1 hypothetical protein BDZ99DRAFT_503226 [Mytilinidion resinicola]
MKCITSVRIRRHLQPTLRSLHSQTRTYAAVSNVPLPTFSAINPPTAWTRNLAESALIIKQPELIIEHGIRHINLIPNDYPPWDWSTKPHNTTCADQLSTILSGLDTCPAISGITIHLSSILALPISHNPTRTPSSASTPHIFRSPTTILSTLSLPATCTDLGRWSLPFHPRISIIDPPTLTLLHHLRASPDKPTFLARVAASGNHALQAGEYTTDFYSRDLRCARPPPASHASTRISLGPYGAGTVSPASADELSVDFANDLAKNTAFLERGEGVWRAGMYDAFREERGWVSSTLAGSMKEGAREWATSVEIKGMPEGMTGEELEGFRARVGEMMECGEDEEVVFMGDDLSISPLFCICNQTNNSASITLSVEREHSANRSCSRNFLARNAKASRTLSIQNQEGQQHRNISVFSLSVKWYSTRSKPYPCHHFLS